MEEKENVLLSEEARKKYINRTFTLEGKDTLEQYIYSLVELYYTLNESKFPYTLPPVLGIPYLRTIFVYETKRDLEMHIKSIMHLLALEGVRVKVNDEYKEYRLEINKDGSKE
jgi:hypothetical protein